MATNRSTTDPEIARLRRINAELVSALEMVLPMADAYLTGAPSHPDHAKLEQARAAIAQAKGEST